MDSFKGVVIEESLEDRSVLREVEIISTAVEKVTDSHKTPWIPQWTLHTVEVPKKDAARIAHGRVGEVNSDARGVTL